MNSKNNQKLIKILNHILTFFGIDYLLETIMKPSGQRNVFIAHQLENDTKKYVIKITRLIPYHVARLQREIKILNEIDSQYFPHIYHHQFITRENLENYYDNFSSANRTEKIKNIKAIGITPFFLTIEEYIPNISWEDRFPAPVSQKDLINFLTHIFVGLGTLWKLQQAHRDLKPENILITPEGDPVIIDLGISKSLREDTVDLTIPGMISPHTKRYASLEQLLNQQENITYKTDQFSIGLISYFLLTKKFPYGDIIEMGPDALIDNMQNRKVISIKEYCPNLNKRFGKFIHKLIDIEPYKRYRNSKSIIQELKQIQGEFK